VFFAHFLDDALEELLQRVVGVFSSVDYLLLEVLAESVLALGGVAVVEELQGSLERLAAFFVNLELQGGRCQEIVQDYKSIIDQLFITD